MKGKGYTGDVIYLESLMCMFGLVTGGFDGHESFIGVKFWENIVEFTTIQVITTCKPLPSPSHKDPAPFILQ